jgi:hypothetical protein
MVCPRFRAASRFVNLHCAALHRGTHLEAVFEGVRESSAHPQTHARYALTATPLSHVRRIGCIAFSQWGKARWAKARASSLRMSTLAPRGNPQLDGLSGGHNIDTSTPVASVTARYPARWRRQVSRLCVGSPRMAEMAAVFPGLVVAIASRRGPARARTDAKRMIEDGTSLKVVAKTLDMPMWARRLPPEAFAEIPDHMPDGDGFSRRIAGRVPRAPSASAYWLEVVAFAAKSSGDNFAVWLAGQPVFQNRGDVEPSFGVLAAYAWFSHQPATLGHRYIVVPWRPEISIDTALCAAKSWFNRVRLVLQLPEGTLTDPWLTPQVVNGFTFEPLLHHADIFAEAQAMQNCADQFAERLALGSCRLFSVKKNNQRIATLEIAQHEREAGILAIRQLKARHNMPAPSDVWQAAYAWLSHHAELRRVPPLTATKSLNAMLDQDAWRRVLEPYRETHNGAPWFDEQASYQMFSCLDQHMAELARRAGVSSWLFN